MYNLLVIHGAWSTPRCFKYIEQNISYKNINEVIQFSYDCNMERLETIVERAKKILHDSAIRTIVVGHSLGGLIGLALHDHPMCSKLITLATPLAGVSIPYLLESAMVMRAPILRSVAPHSAFVKELHSTTYIKPIFSFITTQGYSPFIIDKSDGVITVSSQEQWQPQSAYSMPLKCNHFEILQRDEVIDAIDRFSLVGLDRS
jgi:pimeloyl-ACP methyl ester carboxylesterase